MENYASLEILGMGYLRVSIKTMQLTNLFFATSLSGYIAVFFI